MRNLLQYGYSIFVFFGVLATAYLAINKESADRTPLRAMSGNSLRAEATLLDPAVTQLFEMEQALSRLDSPEKASQRQPSRIEIVLPSPPTGNP